MNQMKQQNAKMYSMGPTRIKCAKNVYFMVRRFDTFMIIVVL